MRKTRLVILPGVRSLRTIGCLLLFLACPNIAFEGGENREVETLCKATNPKELWLLRLREPDDQIAGITEDGNFGDRHWLNSDHTNQQENLIHEESSCGQPAGSGLDPTSLQGMKESSRQEEAIRTSRATRVEGRMVLEPSRAIHKERYSSGIRNAGAPSIRNRRSSREEAARVQLGGGRRTTEGPRNRDSLGERSSRRTEPKYRRETVLNRRNTNIEQDRASETRRETSGNYRLNRLSLDRMQERDRSEETRQRYVRQKRNAFERGNQLRNEGQVRNDEVRTQDFRDRRTGSNYIRAGNLEDRSRASRLVDARAGRSSKENVPQLESRRDVRSRETQNGRERLVVRREFLGIHRSDSRIDAEERKQTVPGTGRYTENRRAERQRNSERDEIRTINRREMGFKTMERRESRREQNDRQRTERSASTEYRRRTERSTSPEYRQRSQRERQEDRTARIVGNARQFTGNNEKFRETTRSETRIQHREESTHIRASQRDSRSLPELRYSRSYERAAQSQLDTTRRVDDTRANRQERATQSERTAMRQSRNDNKQGVNSVSRDAARSEKTEKATVQNDRRVVTVVSRNVRDYEYVSRRNERTGLLAPSRISRAERSPARDLESRSDFTRELNGRIERMPDRAVLGREVEGRAEQSREINNRVQRGAAAISRNDRNVRSQSRREVQNLRRQEMRDNRRSSTDRRSSSRDLEIIEQIKNPLRNARSANTRLTRNNYDKPEVQRMRRDSSIARNERSGRDIEPIDARKTVSTTNIPKVTATTHFRKVDIRTARNVERDARGQQRTVETRREKREAAYRSFSDNSREFKNLESNGRIDQRTRGQLNEKRIQRDSFEAHHGRLVGALSEKWGEALAPVRARKVQQPMDDAVKPVFGSFAWNLEDTRVTGFGQFGETLFFGGIICYALFSNVNKKVVF